MEKRDRKQKVESAIADKVLSRWVESVEVNSQRESALVCINMAERGTCAATPEAPHMLPLPHRCTHKAPYGINPAWVFR